MRWVLCTGLAIAIFSVTGCNQGNVATDNTAQRLPAGVVEVLPENTAGSPMNLRIPRLDRPPVTRAVYDGGHISIHDQSKWRGTTVTLYYLPRYNLIHRGTHYTLTGAKGVQRIGKYRIDANGHWRANWNVGKYPVPAHKSLYILVVTDAGQVGLAHSDTL